MVNWLIAVMEIVEERPKTIADVVNPVAVMESEGYRASVTDYGIAELVKVVVVDIAE